MMIRVHTLALLSLCCGTMTLRAEEKARNFVLVDKIVHKVNNTPITIQSEKIFQTINSFLHKHTGQHCPFKLVEALALGYKADQFKISVEQETVTNTMQEIAYALQADRLDEFKFNTKLQNEFGFSRKNLIDHLELVGKAVKTYVNLLPPLQAKDVENIREEYEAMPQMIVEAYSFSVAKVDVNFQTNSSQLEWQKQDKVDKQKLSTRIINTLDKLEEGQISDPIDSLKNDNKTQVVLRLDKVHKQKIPFSDIKNELIAQEQTKAMNRAKTQILRQVVDQVVIS